MKIAGQVSLADLPRVCPLLCRSAHPEYGEAETRAVEVRGVRFGEERPVVIGGPCAVETQEQTRNVARAGHRAGADMLRGGAYKPRTSPYSFQGLGEKALEILARVREEFDIPVITEAIDHDSLQLVEQYADCIQIGARNMQNFALLKSAGRSRKPVLLKRGMAATLEELLLSAEYIMSEGNYAVMLCERGIRTYEEYCRNTLALPAVPALQRASHLPVVVDDLEQVPVPADHLDRVGGGGRERRSRQCGRVRDRGRGQTRRAAGPR